MQDSYDNGYSRGFWFGEICAQDILEGIFQDLDMSDSDIAMQIRNELRERCKEGFGEDVDYYLRKYGRSNRY